MAPYANTVAFEPQNHSGARKETYSLHLAMGYVVAEDCVRVHGFLDGSSDNEIAETMRPWGISRALTGTKDLRTVRRRKVLVWKTRYVAKFYWKQVVSSDRKEGRVHLWNTLCTKVSSSLCFSGIFNIIRCMHIYL